MVAGREGELCCIGEFRGLKSTAMENKWKLYYFHSSGLKERMTY